MKILHATSMQTYSPGIYNQMIAECQAARDINVSFDVRIFCPKDVYPSNEIVEYASFTIKSHPIRKLDSWLRLRKEYYSWLKSQEEQYDILILRNSVHDPFLLNFIKHSNTQVLLMHHTLEAPELKSLGYKGYIRYVADKYIGSACINKSNGLIGVTNEIIQFEKSRIGNTKIKSFLYPNGIEVNNNQILEDNRTEKTELIFVASYFFEWHGLDILLKDVRNSNDEFILHVIGEVNNSHIRSAITDKRVVFHGKLKKEEIAKIAQRCNVGLSSFALYRKGMNEACTLKTREYLSLGIPVYSGHRDIFPSDFPYYKYDLPSIKNILKFAEAVRLVSRDLVRERSNELISKRILLSNLIESLEEAY